MSEFYKIQALRHNIDYKFLTESNLVGHSIFQIVLERFFNNRILELRELVQDEISEAELNIILEHRFLRWGR